MPATTQKQEAMQAVRLLFDAALAGDREPKTQAQVETLYQARRVIEAHILDARVLDATENADELHYRGKIFRVGDNVIVQGGTPGVIAGYGLYIDTKTSKYTSWHASQVYEPAPDDGDIKDGVEITVSNGERIVVPSDFYEWLKSTGAQP